MRDIRKLAMWNLTLARQTYARLAANGKEANYPCNMDEEVKRIARDTQIPTQELFAFIKEGKKSDKLQALAEDLDEKL